MRLVNVVAALSALAFVAAIGVALRHQQPPGAGVHTALVLDVSGTSRSPDRCDAAGILVDLGIADQARARVVDAWLTGTRARSDAEPVHVATWTRPRVPLSVEQRTPGIEPDAARDELIARCRVEPPASQSPLYAALAAALDGLRPAGCGSPGVDCLAVFATDGIETDDRVLMARQSAPTEEPPRLDNHGIDVILCGGAARVPVARGALPTRADVEAAWRAELQDPTRLAIYPVCVPGMRVQPQPKE